MLSRPTFFNGFEADAILVPQALQVGHQSAKTAHTRALQPVEQALAVDVEHKLVASVVVQFGPRRSQPLDKAAFSRRSLPRAAFSSSLIAS